MRKGGIEKSRYLPYDGLMSANAKYKESVFSFLFGNPEALRGLYSALENEYDDNRWSLDEAIAVSHEGLRAGL